MKKGLYQEMSESKISTQDISQNISTKHSLKTKIPPTDSKEKLAQKEDLWREISTK